MECTKKIHFLDTFDGERLDVHSLALNTGGIRCKQESDQDGKGAMKEMWELLCSPKIGSNDQNAKKGRKCDT